MPRLAALGKDRVGDGLELELLVLADFRSGRARQATLRLTERHFGPRELASRLCPDDLARALPRRDAVKRNHLTTAKLLESGFVDSFKRFLNDLELTLEHILPGEFHDDSGHCHPRATRSSVVVDARDLALRAGFRRATAQRRPRNARDTTALPDDCSSRERCVNQRGASCLPRVRQAQRADRRGDAERARDHDPQRSYPRRALHVQRHRGDVVMTS